MSLLQTASGIWFVVAATAARGSHTNPPQIALLCSIAQSGIMEQSPCMLMAGAGGDSPLQALMGRDGGGLRIPSLWPALPITTDYMHCKHGTDVKHEKCGSLLCTHCQVPLECFITFYLLLF